MLKKLVILSGCIALLGQSARPETAQQFRQSVQGGAHASLSGQFTTRNAPFSEEPPIELRNVTNFVRLDPSLTGVSCERIKKVFLNELGMRDQWKDRIYLELHQARSTNETVVIHSALLDNNWVYNIQVPDVMDHDKFIGAVVSAMLLEVSNRKAIHCAEIPLWLQQGLAAQVIASSPNELVVEPPKRNESGMFLTRLYRDHRRADPLVLAHEYLQVSTPLPLEELTWPKPGQLDGNAAMVYRSSAQLFLTKLLKLKDGRASMQSFLEKLPDHFNWQISFFEAFKNDFSGQLELEKWWALQLSDFTGHNLTQLWDISESWKKLDEVLRPTVEVRTKPNEPPFRSQVTLQTVLKEWDRPSQSHLLQEKVQQLFVIRYRIAPQLAVLVDDYQKALTYFLKHRDGLAFDLSNRNLYSPLANSITEETLTALQELDIRRQQLRPKIDPTPSITANSRN